ncbi:M14 family zinc carboxypeptidase [Marinicella rhabdoformis]|uniref:M14 family zinc carboxypeptidase n=1 Tax=Marinicella rhabdoformis TaxID=2580566 RepID=UPI0012AED142|nr:M14 family zinc carboxypeptidase [Marinicella rhabdoformis]
MSFKYKQSLIAALLVSSAGLGHTQQITHWTEQNGTLGLGYPVPVPVDTPEPFDGFRTYDGLHSKHMQITDENPHVTAHVIGQTIDGRDIWAYRLSDENQLTQYGVPEGGMLMNAGIHAREWQSPETATGVMELLHDNRNDESIHQFLLENTQIVIIPVNNIDGFLQTQRYPTSNYYSNQGGPRDGRMRRKNMRNVDEVLTTRSDHLFGIDLNRNNDPYWAFTENSNNPRSSGDPTSIVHRGIEAFSEPESIARRDSVNLLDPDHLRVYTDVHSFSLVHFSTLTFNQNRNILQGRLLSDFTSYHKEMPGNKNYVNVPSAPGGGIGATDEYFGYTYEVPSWTLEIEPSNGGVDYGGFGNDGHDGFILPESEIRRVRENLAKTFVATWYGQAGPPSAVQMRLIDPEIDAVVYDAEWDTIDQNTRDLFENRIDRIKPGKKYQMLLRFDKPMRIRNAEGEASGLTGINLRIDPVIQAQINGQPVTLNFENGEWLNQKTNTWKSYGLYKDDTFVTDVTIDENLSYTQGDELTWRFVVTDLLNQVNDGNPATVVTWSDGQWQNYESTDGSLGINGGFDNTLSVRLGSQSINDVPARVAATGLYYAPDRAGEGISLEVLDSENFWMTFYSFNEHGQQDWFTGQNNYSGNLLKTPLTAVSGGIFGPDFNPDNISLQNKGEIEMVFSGGVSLAQPIGLQYWYRNAAVKFTYPDGSKFRTTWDPLSVAAGFYSDLFMDGIGSVLLPPVAPNQPPSYTGSWYNADRAGVGYHIQILEDNRAALLWYSFSPEGDKKWFVDMQGEITDTDSGVTLNFNNISTASGTMFGANFNPNDVVIEPWGSAEFKLSCFEGSMTYQSTDNAYGTGGYDIEPLTRPAGNMFGCN